MGLNSSAHLALSVRSRTDAVICNWKWLQRLFVKAFFDETERKHIFSSVQCLYFEWERSHSEIFVYAKPQRTFFSTFNSYWNRILFWVTSRLVRKQGFQNKNYLPIGSWLWNFICQIVLKTREFPVSFFIEIDKVQKRCYTALEFRRPDFPG